MRAATFDCSRCRLPTLIKGLELDDELRPVCIRCYLASRPRGDAEESALREVRETLKERRRRSDGV